MRLLAAAFYFFVLSACATAQTFDGTYVGWLQSTNGNDCRSEVFHIIGVDGRAIRILTTDDRRFTGSIDDNDHFVITSQFHDGGNPVSVEWRGRFTDSTYGKTVSGTFHRREAGACEYTFRSEGKSQIMREVPRKE